MVELVLVMVYDAAVAIGVKSVRKDWWLAIFLSAFTVVIGVVLMSILSCSLLSQIYHEEGPFRYTAGNFAVHYLPLCRLAVWPDTTLLSLKDVDRPKSQAVKACGPIILYTLLFNANTIYGCTKTSPAIVSLLLVLLPVSVFTACILHTCAHNDTKAPKISLQFRFSRSE